MSKHVDYVLQYDEHQKKVKFLLEQFQKNEISFEKMSEEVLKEVSFLEAAYVQLVEESQAEE